MVPGITDHHDRWQNCSIPCKISDVVNIALASGRFPAIASDFVTKVTNFPLMESKLLYRDVTEVVLGNVEPSAD